MIRFLLLAFASCAFLVGCDSAPTSAGTMDETNHSVQLTGVVRTPAGRPLSGLKVALGSRYAVSDSEGHWAISGSALEQGGDTSGRFLRYSWQGQALREDSLGTVQDTGIRRWFTVRTMDVSALDSLSRDSLLGRRCEVKAIGRWWDVEVDSVRVRLSGGPWKDERRVALDYARGTIQGTLLLPWSPDSAYRYRAVVEVWGNGGLSGVSDTLTIAGDAQTLTVPRFDIGNRLPVLALGANLTYPVLGSVYTLVARSAAPVARWEWRRGSGDFVAGDSLLTYVPLEQDSTVLRWTVRARFPDGRWAQASLITYLDLWSATSWLLDDRGWAGPLSDTVRLRQAYGLTFSPAPDSAFLGEDSVLTLSAGRPALGIRLGLGRKAGADLRGDSLLWLEMKASSPGTSWALELEELGGQRPGFSGTLGDTGWIQVAVPLMRLRCADTACPDWNELGGRIAGLAFSFTVPGDGPHRIQMRRIRLEARQPVR